MGLFSGKSKSQTQVDPMRRDLTLAWQNRLTGLSQKPFEFFPGQTYADVAPEQEEALGMREQFARGMAGMVDPSMDAWRGMLSAPDVANNPYVQGMLEQQADIAGRSFREALPGIESAAIGAGQFGGSRQGVVEALKERGIREALAQSAAQTQLGAYQQGLAQQRYGLSAAPGMAQLGMMPSDVLMGVGGFRRAEDQRAIDEARARHDFAQEEPWRRLERYIGTFEPMSRPYTTTTAEQQYTPSAFSVGTQLAGLGMAGMGAFGLGGPSAGIAGGATTPAMSPYMPSPGLDPWLQDMRSYYG